MTAPFHPESTSAITLGGPTCLQLKHEPCLRGKQAAAEYEKLTQDGTHSQSRQILRHYGKHDSIVFWDITQGRFVRVEWTQPRSGGGQFGPKLPMFTVV